MRRILITAPALALALAVGSASWSQIATSAAGSFSTGPNGESILSGQTMPIARVEIPAGMRGQLAEVDVKEGQVVKKGDVLAKLDDSIQQVIVDLAKEEADSTVEIRGAEHQVAFSQHEYDTIHSNPSRSPSEDKTKELALQQSKLSLEIEKEKQHQSQTKLKREQITLDHMTIRSPIDGSILRINKQPGEETDENPLAIVVQTSRLAAAFFPPKQLFGKIHVGDKASLKVEDKTREAIVVSVDPVLDQELFRVKMEFDNADGTIPAGTPATWTWKGK